MNKSQMINNVIIVCDYGFIEGGAGRIAHETALGLQKSGMKVCLLCAVGPVSEALLEAGVEVICLNQKDILHEENRIKAVMRGLYNRTASEKFSALLDRFSPEQTVIHVHSWSKAISSSIFPVAQKKGFRVFLTVHDYFLVCPNGGLFDYPAGKICERKPLSINCLACNCDPRSYLQKLYRVFRQWIQNKCIFECKNIRYLFISEFSKEQFLHRCQKVPLSRQLYLPNMINFPENRSRIECENNNVFLFIGSIYKAKGIQVFCDAVTQAKVPAVVIGEGPLRQELQEKYPHISFVGWKSKEEMKPYLNKTRALVFPSLLYETFGLTVLEMMAYGIPVICSNWNSARDFITQNRSGWIYEGNSAKDLADCIRNCIHEENYKNISENVYNEFDSEKYGINSYIENLLSNFQH